MTSARAWIGMGLVALVSVAAVGMTAGLLLGADDTPRSLQGAAAVRTVRVTEQSFTDVRSVEVDFRLGVEGTLSTPVGGRVTAFDCSADEPFVSGRSNLEVDGVRIVSISTRVPLWRDLSEGDRGEDVAALQKELSRLGSPLVADGVVGRRTIAAVEDLLAPHATGSSRERLIPARRFLWLPHPQTAIAACTTSTGSPVQADDDVASLAVMPISASVDPLPADAVPGARVLVVGGHQVPVSADGRIDGSTSLAVIAASAPFAEARRNSVTSMTADLALTHPVRAAGVPPGALYDVTGSTACVVAGGKARAVTVVGSELGVSLVTFSAGAAPSTIDIAPKGAAPCR